MIVLDEQLLGRNLEYEIATWYHGAVVFITDLRPYTVIKDEAIPMLLRKQPRPTFVTINERDFWNRVAIDDRFCVVCFTLSDARTHALTTLLRTLLRHSELDTKRKRMGKVIRVTETMTSYYTIDDRAPKVLV